MPERNAASDLLRSIDICSRVTGIGSVPFSSEDQATEYILEYCPLIPYVPQLMKRDIKENMFLQFSEHLPCIGADVEKNRVFFDESVKREEALAKFYDYIECKRTFST